MDSTNGLIIVPDGIYYHGGGGTLDKLTFQGQEGFAVEGVTSSGKTQVNSLGQVVTIENVEVKQPLAALTNPAAYLGTSLAELSDWSKGFDNEALLGTSFPLLGPSLGRALNGVNLYQHDGGNPLGEPVDVGETAADGTGDITAILRRVFETGANSLRLADIGTSITSLTALRD